jgi:type IV pilus assembly protein PilN
MYSLDVNFLKDRGIIPEAGNKTGIKSKKANPGDMLPLVAGVAVGLLLPAAVGGLWFFVTQQTAELEQQQKAQEGKLNQLKAKQEEVTRINDQISKINSETKALATVFNQIKPWSAMLQDLRDRTPPNVQIEEIEQREEKVTAAANQTKDQLPPQPLNKVFIKGIAVSFNDVNDFLLTIQRSPFFKKDETKIISAKMQKLNIKQADSPQSKSQGASQAAVKIEWPEVVGFMIETNLSDLSATELVRELERKGDVGLVTRIRNLQEKGATQQ